MQGFIRKLATAPRYISKLSPRRKLTALSLVLTVAAASIVVPRVAGTLAAPGDPPGTQGYYDDRWAEAKIKAGDLAIGTAYTNNTGAAAVTAVEGPWKLDLNYTSPAAPDYCSAPWGGSLTGVVPAATKNGGAYGALVNPYLVKTADELRYCMVGRYSFILQNNIDLAGYRGMQWTIPANNAVNTPFIADGNGKTVYNYYVAGTVTNGTSFFGIGVSNNASSKIINLRLSNAFMNDVIASNFGFFAYAPAAPVNNCAVENAMASCALGTQNFLFGFSSNGLSFDNCYTRNVHLYNRGIGGSPGPADMAHVAGFGMAGSAVAGGTQTISNCFVIDGTIISNGGHSGGFFSCGIPTAAGNTLTNCFTNDIVYGNKLTGAFIGIVGTAGGLLTVNNCYASGMVEGTANLGGFMGSVVNTGTATVNITNCYTTAMVGMNGGGTNLGGFLSNQATSVNGSAPIGNYTIKNCYAAGEVGSLDTDVTPGRTANEDVGGFTGVQTATGMSYTNCYYDKQTTAMREWTTGASQTMAGITGLLTTDTAAAKSGAGLAGTSPKAGLTPADGWVLTADHYPQLAVFADPATIGQNFTNTNWLTQAQLTNLVKANSEASTSTAKCNTYEKGYDGSALPSTTYDTVRDLTLPVPMTLASNNAWSKISISGVPAEPTVTLYKGTVNVLDLLQNGDQYTAANFAPGIQWLNVQVTESGQIGQRNLRLVPTSNLTPGKSRTVATGDTYNHAADVDMAYSTGARMNAAQTATPPTTDITQGVFPDNPMTASQQAIQSDLSGAPTTPPYLLNFQNADNKYTAVNVGQMDLNAAHTSQLKSNATGGKMYVKATNIGSAKLGDGGPFDDKFNGVTAFAPSDGGSYKLTYDWVLADGRYLEASKIIVVQMSNQPLPGSYLKYTGYDMTNGVNGNTGMDGSTSNYGTAADKYFGAIYLNGYIWYTPAASNAMMRQDAVTGQITGFPLTGIKDALDGSSLAGAAGLSAATLNKYHGDPVYAGGYLWFAPYNSGILLRLDPTDGSMVGYKMSTGYNGNDTMPSNVCFSSIVYDGVNLWLIPLYANRIVRVEPSTGRMVGFDMSTGGNMDTISSSDATVAKYEAAAYDSNNDCIWLAPWNADKFVKISNLGSNAPTFNGYNIPTGNGVTSSCVGTASQKFHGCVFVDGSIWMTPQKADSAVRVSNLGGNPAFAGYLLSDGVNMNTANSTAAGIAKYHYAAYDGKYIWVAPFVSDRLLRIDPSDGSMTGYVLPYYKQSMANDLPYDSSGFHNYFNNNNWGMTAASASGGGSLYGSACFDGNNLWLAPQNADRVVKISPSVDEVIPAPVGATVTVKLTNYMTNASPGSTIDKIEWLRVRAADTPNLSYKGNTQSPYTDTRNAADGASDPNAGKYFDENFANAAVADKGTVYANGYGDMGSQTLTFQAPANGVYYVKAYFTDPLNEYGMDAAYDTARGTPRMVTVVKEVAIALTVTLHVRQVVDGITINVPVPDTGYMSLSNVDPGAPGTPAAGRNVTTPSGMNAAAVTYADFILPMDPSTKAGYAVLPVIPQYYTYEGYSLGQSNTSPDGGSGLAVADFSSADERWATIYIKPASNPKNNDTAAADNVFRKAFGVQLKDKFPNFDTPPEFGGTVNKAVGATNTNATNAFVRIMVQPVLTAADGTLLPIVGAANGSPIGKTSDVNATLQCADLNETDWTYGGDGYYYYMSALKPGQAANDLFKTITLGANLSDAYKGATLTIEVKCEAAGTAPESFEVSFWGAFAAPGADPLKTIDQTLKNNP